MDVEPIDSPSCENLANGQNLTWENLDFDALRFCLLLDSSVTGYTPFINGVSAYLHIRVYCLYCLYFFCREWTLCSLLDTSINHVFHQNVHLN